MVTAGRVIRNTWCERSPSHKVVCEPLGAHSTHLAYGVSRVSCVSNLDIYRSSMSPLWEHRAQCLVMCEIDLVLLLLLLTFRNTLLSYLLVLIRTITAPGIPVRRNIRVLKVLRQIGIPGAVIIRMSTREYNSKIL